MRRIGLWFLAVASPVLVVCQLVGGAAAEWLFAGGAVLFPLALIAAGAGGRRRERLLASTLSILAVLALVAVGSVLGADPGDSTARGILGLPRSALIVVFGLCLIPLALVPACHAAVFDDRESAPAAGDRSAADAGRGR